MTDAASLVDAAYVCLNQLEPTTRLQRLITRRDLMKFPFSTGPRLISRMNFAEILIGTVALVQIHKIVSLTLYGD